MELIAAIDLIDGRGVRLRQGDYARPIVEDLDPVELGASWAAAGVPRLHLVDLDGARAGEPRQLELVGAVVRAARAAAPGIRIQAGGGLRSREAVAGALEVGVDAAVLGTAAVERPGFAAECAARWPGRVLVSLDVRDGRPALDGWRREAEADPVELGRRLLHAGVAGLLLTDAQRDGTLTGPNVALLSSFRGAFPDAWLAGGGGIGSTADLRALQRAGMDGAVVGLALLTGAVWLPEALVALAEGAVSA